MSEPDCQLPALFQVRYYTLQMDICISEREREREGGEREGGEKRGRKERERKKRKSEQSTGFLLVLQLNRFITGKRE